MKALTALIFSIVFCNALEPMRSWANTMMAVAAGLMHQAHLPGRTPKADKTQFKPINQSLLERYLGNIREFVGGGWWFFGAWFERGKLKIMGDNLARLHYPQSKWQCGRGRGKKSFALTGAWASVMS